ncbi:metal ABC transporter substrate-binding protein [Candidimonas nitroreducens]|uniref:Metal ABC transporter substrate-binding protein n=2 Tax=Candidimonas nitroreducens TaxID=683354 RepID=A0A225MGA8_9BURK|nr:metal ABC transporter substrate-binding protein [Candidimonas nitroreducens]
MCADVRGRSGRMLAVLAGAMLLSAAVPAAAADPAPGGAPLRVVASFSVLGDMVQQIGGDHIALTTIVGPNGDVHDFEPSPKDSKALAHAQLLVVNGLGFETWMPRLVQASGFKGLEVVATRGITPRRLSAGEQALERAEERHARHGHERQRAPTDIDPHAWQSLSNGLIYVQNITAGLIKADPAHAADYQSHANMYIAQIKALDAKLKQALAAIPEARRKVVTSHDAFGYFGLAYGVQFIAATGISNEAEPSAKEMARLIDQIKKQHVPAVFLENVTNPKLIQQIARETGAKMGGELYSDALAAPDQPAGTYLGMFEWNAGKLIYALDPKQH